MKVQGYVAQQDKAPPTPYSFERRVSRSRSLPKLYWNDLRNKKTINRTK